VDTGRAMGSSSSSMCVCVCVCVCVCITAACVYNRTGEGQELIKYVCLFICILHLYIMYIYMYK
jgi:hypothetical protein